MPNQPPTADELDLDAMEADLKHELDPNTWKDENVKIGGIRARSHRLLENIPRLIAEVRKLREEVQTWKHRAGSKWSKKDIDSAKTIGKLMYETMQFSEQIKALQELKDSDFKAILRFRKALDFYADGDNLYRWSTIKGCHVPTEDQGKLAREALGEK